jgi:hypothetical protein
VGRSRPHQRAPLPKVARAVQGNTASRPGKLAKPGGDADGSRSADLGRQFGEAFHRLDGDRNPFIETEEREELFDALNAIVDFTEAQSGRAFDGSREHLIAGVEAVRNW